MSSSPTRSADALPAGGTAAPSVHGSACEHCDDSVPHEHLDVRGLIEAARTHARRRAVLMTVTAGAVLVAALLAAALLDGPATALTALAVTAAGWLVVTGVALVVTTRIRLDATRAVLVGALTGAGLTPVAALATSLLADGWTAGLVGGATWLAAGASASAFQARAWRALLLSPGERGEQARAAAVSRRGRPEPGAIRRWLVQGLLVGAAVALLGAVPAAVVVLVPLGVLLAAWSATGSAARR
ncbi:hypothetical protein [Georgenia alba]|uniref:Integral membrane protein n=1 Tax=Georgenia alba TaxID=2233858 RepID=A0ABW2Q8U0_9MICO